MPTLRRKWWIKRTNKAREEEGGDTNNTDPFGSKVVR